MTANAIIGRIRRSILSNPRNKGFERALSDAALGRLTGDISGEDYDRIMRASKTQLRKYDPRKARA